MNKHSLPLIVAEFLNRYIDTVETLEVLLLLTETSERWWIAAEVNDSLRSTTVSIRKRLEDLTDSGLLKKDGEMFRFAPANQEMYAVVEKVAVAYKERRLSVIEIIFSKPTLEMERFSNAFRIRRQDK